MGEHAKVNLFTSLEELTGWLQKDIDDWAHTLATLSKRPENAQVSYKAGVVEILLIPKEVRGIECFYLKGRAAKCIVVKLIAHIKALLRDNRATKTTPITLRFTHKRVSVTFNISEIERVEHESGPISTLHGTLSIQEGC